MAWKLSNTNEKVISEINITPLTDVMLVLLIIFMVTTPLLMMDSFKLKLPKAASAGSETGLGSVVSVSEDGGLYLDGKAVDEDELFSALESKFKAGGDRTVILKADIDTMHGKVVKILDLSRKAGAEKLSIATEPRE